MSRDFKQQLKMINNKSDGSIYLHCVNRVVKIIKGTYSDFIMFATTTQRAKRRKVIISQEYEQGLAFKLS